MCLTLGLTETAVSGRKEPRCFAINASRPKTGPAAPTLACVEKTRMFSRLQEILLYGVKGMCAYAHHARRLGQVDEDVDAFVEEALFATVTNVNFDLDSLLEMVLECGRKNIRVMEMLDAGHTERFGKPEPTTVYEGTKEGPGILVTGHDLLDLSDLLEQAAGAGVNVYTHGEMLPAHSYPGLKQHAHLAGHYGGPWQNQQWEFPLFSGPILGTTNCVLIPPDTYADRLYTTRVTAIPGGTRLTTNDFSAVIEKAKECPPLTENMVRESTIGFHHSVVLGLAGKLVEAVRAGDVKRFYLIGGCDGAEAGRNYYTRLAESSPEESVILTLGCGKYRIRNYDYGTVAGLPRLLDMGQCNDAYGAVQVALALSKALDLGGKRPATGDRAIVV